MGRLGVQSEMAEENRVDSSGSHGSVLQSARCALRKRRKLILVTFALILLGDIVGTYAMTPRWLGEARILVMPGPFHGLAPFGAAGGRSNQADASISLSSVTAWNRERGRGGCAARYRLLVRQSSPRRELS